MNEEFQKLILEKFDSLETKFDILENNLERRFNNLEADVKVIKDSIIQTNKIISDDIVPEINRVSKEVEKINNRLFTMDMMVTENRLELLMKKEY